MEEKQVHMWEREDFPLWSIRDVLVCIVFSFLLAYNVKVLFEAKVKDMSLEVYGSFEKMDTEAVEKVLILGWGAIAFCFFSSFLVCSIALLRRYDLTLSDIGLNRSISKAWVIKSMVGGIVFGHLLYFAIVYLIGPLKGWKMTVTSGKLPLNYALPVHLFAAFYGSIVEEIFFRGISYTAFRRVYGVKWGVILSSIIFVLLHVQHLIQKPMIFIFLFVFGLVVCSVYEKSKSLLPAIIVHIIFNVTIILFSYHLHPFYNTLHHAVHQLFYF